MTEVPGDDWQKRVIEDIELVSKLQ